MSGRRGPCLAVSLTGRSSTETTTNQSAVSEPRPVAQRDRARHGIGLYDPKKSLLLVGAVLLRMLATVKASRKTVAAGSM
jgi:hypothetical protein